tara:strand:- start:686 stop:1246 length:561 start_codon:yes stop_codon:yes gene_type:complete
MSEMKKKVVKTPIGEAKWFSVNKVDKFGNYTVELLLDESADSLRFIEGLNNFSPIKGAKLPYKKTSEGYSVKLKSKSSGTKRDNSTYVISAPPIYNALGQKVSGADLDGLNIGNGSKIRAMVEVKQYNFMGSDGVSIGLKSVQIVEAVAYSGSGQDFGFDALEVEEANRETPEQEASLEESTNYDF